jgi:hypothetical protein
MKKLYSFSLIIMAVAALSSCRQVYNTVVKEEHGTYGIQTVSQFEYLGTMGVSNTPNVLFAEMMGKAREKYGEGVTISNIRSRVNYKSFAGLKFGFQEEVLFDVYKKK